MADNNQIIELYTELAQNPDKDFGWDKGKVFGVDITPKMVELATKHAKEAHANNITILESSFEKINLEDESIDVIISNGAINLTSCKESVFTEIYRILKPTGKIFFADMIDVSEPSCCSIEQSSCCSKDDEEDWANCVAGTMKESELIELMQKSGFKEVECTGHTHYTTAQTTKGATFRATKIPADIRREKHWDGIFQNSDYTQVLWHQNSPKKSVEFIKKYAKNDDNIIDAGCGASYLVDNLLQDGYKNITLLDTSKTSLEIVRLRVAHNSVEYICDDILSFKTDKKGSVQNSVSV